MSSASKYSFNQNLQSSKQNNETTSTVDYSKYFLYPRSVAIIGASKRPGTIGYNVLKCALDSGFQGSIYPINPSSDELLGVKTHPSILNVSGEVDLAILVVPAIASLQVAEECGQKGVHFLVVISDGFKETGQEGAELEKKLVEVVQRHGMRMLGPNCIGIINPDPQVSLNASFCPVFPVSGARNSSGQALTYGYFVTALPALRRTCSPS
jgi:acyl-CoA synthetase (NDP forming)